MNSEHAGHTQDDTLPSFPSSSRLGEMSTNLKGAGSPPSGKASDDQPSFFGLTSQPHVGSPVPQELDPLPDEFTTLGIAVDTNSTQLRDHLLQSYFKYQPLWVNVVDRKNFMAHRTIGAPSRWYSDFLEYTMLACAARLSTSGAIRALSREYVKLAKGEILVALDNPTPASLQGYLLLSEYEVTQGHDRSGWMLCGMCALARMMVKSVVLTLGQAWRAG